MISAKKIAFMLIIYCLGCVTNANANEVYDIRLSGGVVKTRLVIELNDQVAFKVYNITEPNRLIIDFDAVDFILPANIGTTSFGLINEFRYGNFSLTKSRIVFDTINETEVVAAFIVPKKTNKGALLVVDIIKKQQNSLPLKANPIINRDGKQNISAATRSTIDEDLNRDEQVIELDFQPDIPSIDELMKIVANDESIADETSLSGSNQDQISSVTSQSKIDLSSNNSNNAIQNVTTSIAQNIRIDSFVPKPIKRPANMNQIILATRNAQANQAAVIQRKPIIVLDAGHGGIDGGTISRRGTREKYVVLNFAKRLQKQLLATGKYKVYLTRKGDYFVKLRDRVVISRKYKADLFISIHADSVPGRNSSARGASIYTLSDKSSDKEAAALARKENRSDILAGIEFINESKVVTSILIDLVQRDSKSKSIKFASLVVSEIKGHIVTHRKPIKFAGFRVLKAPDVPSVLIELGYLSNIHDERNLKSSAWQNKMATRLRGSIDKYFKNRKLF